MADICLTAQRTKKSNAVTTRAISLPRHPGSTSVPGFPTVYSTEILQSCTFPCSTKFAATSVTLAVDVYTYPVRVPICLPPPLLPYAVDVALLVADLNELLRALVWALAQFS